MPVHSMLVQMVSQIVQFLADRCRRFASAMFHKRQLQDDLQSMPPEKKLRADMMDLFLNNNISANRAHQLCQHADMAGASGFKDLSKIGVKDKWKRNLRRDITRKLIKHSNWPSPYIVNIPCWEPKTQAPKIMKVPLWLPHELVGVIAQRSDPLPLLAHDGLDQANMAHLSKVASAIGHTDASKLLAVGLWADACPYNSNRSKSLEVVSINFPGHSGTDGQLRLPLFTIPKDFMMKDVSTYDCLMAVIAWSFQILLAGHYPHCRHNGEPWLPSDTSRKKLQGKQLQQAVLVEVRGDWSCYKGVFRLQGWREKTGCCYKCNITAPHIKEVHTGADWSLPPNRLSHTDVLVRIAMKGHTISPLFSCPYLEADCFKVDWLHTFDLGVTQDFLASLFLAVLPYCSGSSLVERCKDLHLRMQAYYKRSGCGSRLDELKPSMLQKQGSPWPKLRSKAGECRDLVPFALEVSQLLGNSPEDMAAKICAERLNDCYACLSASTFCAAKLQTCMQQFALQYVGLHEAAAAQGVCRWPVKPKFHLALELTRTGCLPTRSWTYRDEDFGGVCSKLCARRGGAVSPFAVGISCLQRFAAQHTIPTFVRSV